MSAVKQKLDVAPTYSFGTSNYTYSTHVRGYEDDITKEVVQALQEEANKDLNDEEWVRVDGFYFKNDASVG